jgi:hydroxyisourate hydrolase
VRLAVREAEAWREIASASTDADGRVPQLAAGAGLAAGGYRLTFDIGAYFQRRGVESFYALVTVEFIVRDERAHHHVPLLVSPFGYSTYRGS